ncbi:unnamed protein product [Bursaphelenchus xylophilus]|uniref:(pine wood nematode) hypothetical protein n=1 Tax=Bursaphelenchus xylophilus TaxID=6326 RepID=A0A1I7RZM1_BURXY|nr:unnamed protein product [Bursaphelenchus xylophilus]CAG9111403.1 unnamed protein product [Bursaphelenchus xylophilus]
MDSALGFLPDGPVYLQITAYSCFGISTFLFSAAFFNFFAAFRYFKWSQTREILDGGVVSFGFFFSAIFIILSLTTPWIYVFFHLADALRVKYLLSAVLISHTLFWMSVGIKLFIFRYEKTESASSRIFHTLYMMALTIPVFLSGYFPVFDVHSGYGKTYIFQYVITFYLLLAALFGWNRPKPADSGIAEFYKKSELIAKYMWPKGAHMVKCRIFLCFLTIILGRAINIVVPLYSKWIVDALTGENRRFCWDLIGIASILKYLQGNGAMGGFLNTIRSILWLSVQQYTTMTIETEVYRHLLHLPYSWHINKKSGEVLKIIDRGTASIDNFLSYLLFNIVPTIVDVVLAIFFFVSVFDIYFGILVTVTMVGYMTATVFVTRWRIKFRRAMNAASNECSAVALDSLINYETVKYFCNEDLEHKRYKTSIIKYQSCEKKSVYSLQALNGLQNTILGVAMLIGSLMMAYQIAEPKSKLSAGDFVLFSTYLLQLSVPLNFFGTVYNMIQRSFTDMENMFALLAEPPEDSDESPRYSIEHFGGLRMDNVKFGYANDRVILDNVTFSVAEGKSLALVGASGSGKSTIIRLLYRLYNVKDGCVSMGGMDVKMLDLKQLRMSMGIVPQDCVLFNETIEYNIRYGRPDATFEEVEDAAKAAQIHDFILQHPDGYKCLVGERGLKLSGGEKQRVAIARTILKRPHFIFLDEATSSLDSKTERQIQSALHELCQGKTAVIVAHRLSTVVNADKIVVLDNGKIVEEGSHSELLEQNGVYARMWELQQAGDISSPPSTNDLTHKLLNGSDA